MTPEASAATRPVDLERSRIGPRRQDLLRRARRWLNEIRDDPVLRRELRYRPHAALETRGLDAALAPGSLPVRLNHVDVLLNGAQLFGAMPAPAPDPPPLELRLVIYGAKPAALLHGPEPAAIGWLRWAERHGLHAVLSPDEWDAEADVGKGGYCNATGVRRRARAGSGAWRGLFVAPDPAGALLGWLCLVYGWEILLGRLLGYPACCAEAYNERWPQVLEQHQGDPSIPSLLSSGTAPYDWRVNIFSRYLGHHLIQHFPCRFDCEGSLALAARCADALARHEPDVLREIEQHLRAPVVYAERGGIAVLPGADVCVAEGDLRVDYDPRLVRATLPAAPLGQAVLGARSLVASPSAATVRVAGQDFPAWLAWFDGEVAA